MSETTLRFPGQLSGTLPSRVRWGRAWFRWRSFSPIPFFLFMLCLRPDFSLHGGWLTLVVTGIALAEALRIWSVGYAGSATRTRGDKVNQLVHAGPYRFVRNPLYIANVLLYSLCGVLFGFGWLSLALFGFSCVEYALIVAFEEDILTRTFGPAYSLYRTRVPRWFPSLRPGCPASDHHFDLARGLKSEKSTFYSIAAMAGLFALKRYWLG